MNNARLRQQRPNHYGEEYPVQGTDWSTIVIGIAVAIVILVLIW